MATRRLTKSPPWQPSQPPGTERRSPAHHITSHHITHTHHTTPSPHSVSSGVESHQVEHVRFLGLGGAGTNTNTNKSNDGNDILESADAVHQRRTVLLTVRLVFECADDRQ
jgi:hypothetical protein